jgi:hypothetical protein
MGKTALKKYLVELDNQSLQEQILDLYERFPDVKSFYDFAFNPKEDKLIAEARARISNEYFPLKRKRPRARRSVAQKLIRNYTTLGMDPVLLADLMLFNLETAQRFSLKHRVNDAFYKSMLRSFAELVGHVAAHNVQAEFVDRLKAVHAHTQKLEWEYRQDFDRIFQTHILTDL